MVDHTNYEITKHDRNLSLSLNPCCFDSKKSFSSGRKNKIEGLHANVHNIKPKTTQPERHDKPS